MTTPTKTSDCPKCGEYCYARMLNKAGDGRPVYDEARFCPTCNAHLSASGICLNACHLSAESRSRFHALFVPPSPGK